MTYSNMIFGKMRASVALFLRSKGKASFLNLLPIHAKVLDVGCGNNSPFKIKLQRPDLFYVGLDICDYNQKTNPDFFADQYIIASPDEFLNRIKEFCGFYDAVISSHNLEHCVDQEKILDAMLNALKPGGRIYISFPCEKSVFFPKCRGTLNFYDDPTHLAVPKLEKIVSIIEHKGFKINFLTKRYRPVLLFFIGIILEPLRFVLKCNMPFGSTWALYGFETIIWASKSV